MNQEKVNQYLIWIPLISSSDFYGMGNAYQSSSYNEGSQGGWGGSSGGVMSGGNDGWGGSSGGQGGGYGYGGGGQKGGRVQSGWA